MNPSSSKNKFREGFLGGIFGSKKITKETGSKQEEIAEVFVEAPESSIDKKQQQESLVDERVAQEHPLYTTEISEIIRTDEPLLDPIYYKKLADKIIEAQMGGGLFDHSDYRLIYLIKKGDLDKSYYQWMYDNSSCRDLDRSDAKKALAFIKEHGLGIEYYKKFIDQILEGNKNRGSEIRTMISLVKTACSEGNIIDADYQNTMLRFLDLPRIYEQEAIEIVKMFLEHDREAEVYKGILMKIIVDKKLLTYLYFRDTFSLLYKKTNDEMGRDYRCAKIIDTCVDDYLEGTHLEMGKIHIKIALDAYKNMKKLSGLEYSATLDNIKEAGIQLLISE